MSAPSRSMIVMSAALCVSLLIGCITVWMLLQKRNVSKKTMQIAKPMSYKQVSALRIPQLPDTIFVEMLSDNPRVMIFHNFLSADECQHLIQLAEPRMAPSTVQLETLSTTPDRTSFTTNLQRHETPVVKQVESRAVMFANYPMENLEPLQVVRYHPNQFYRPHFDYFEKGKRGTKEALARGGQRTVTMFVYLNSLPVEETGGATVFPELNLRVKPKAGTAVYFLNVTPDGQEDSRLLHAGEAPKMSTKYGLNIWFRQRAFT